MSLDLESVLSFELGQETGLQRARRFAKHALRYRKRTKDMRLLKGFAYEFVAKRAEAERDRLRELLREATKSDGSEEWRKRVAKELGEK